MTNSPRGEGSEPTEYNDSELVNLAKAGNLDAFDELISRHRGRAIEWARQVTTDAHLAEDVVQDALIRAFLHLGSLMDMNRFLPWFQRIVRNQALKKIRRGGHYAKERPFTSLTETEADWGSIDNILQHLSKQYVQSRERASDPSLLIEKGDIVLMIQDLLHCLSNRERSIFEAHFFDELSPLEIAKLFNTTTLNVYKLLSRSKQKLQLEKRYYYSIQNYVTHKTHRGKMTQVTLDLPQLMGTKYIHPDVQVAHCVFHAMNAVFKGALSYSEFMGRAGYAFQLNIEGEHVHVSGLGNYHWDSFFTNGMLNLGFHSRYMFKFGSQPPPAALQTALNIIRQSIDRGIPAIVMEGLIYGYDDLRQLLLGVSVKKTFEISYSQFGRGSFGCYVYACEEKFEMLFPSSIYRWLRTLVEYSTGKLQSSFGGHTHGLKAFDAWIKVYKNRAIDELGNASTVAVVHDARNHAVECLRIIAERWEKELPADELTGQLLREAALQYAISTEAFRQLSLMFPFPQGGTPNEDNHAETAINLLTQARDAEGKGIALFERILYAIGNTIVLASVPETAAPSPFHSFGSWILPAPRINLPPYIIQFYARIIRVSHLKNAIHFYSEHLGIPIIYGNYDNPIYAFNLGNGTKLLLEDDRDPLAYEESPVCLWVTNDLERALEQVQTLGWSVIQAIASGPTMRFFVFKDGASNVMMVSNLDLEVASMELSATWNSHIFMMDTVFLQSNKASESIKQYEQFLGNSTISIVTKENQSQLQCPATNVNFIFSGRTPLLTASRCLLELNRSNLQHPAYSIKDPDGNIITFKASHNPDLREEVYS